MSIKCISVSKTYFISGDSSQAPPAHRPEARNHRHRVHALLNVSIDINEGSFTIITGPTGSGKTTLLSMLAGIALPSEGEVAIGRLRLTASKDADISLFRARHIGFIPQTVCLIGDLSVLENVIAPSAFQSMSIPHLRASALALLERLGLARKAACKPHDLSGGEMRKVMIARATVKEPSYILADEPLSDLDRDSAVQALRLFSDLHKRGAAVVIATQAAIRLKRPMDIYRLEGGIISRHRRGRGA